MTSKTTEEDNFETEELNKLLQTRGEGILDIMLRIGEYNSSNGKKTKYQIKTKERTYDNAHITATNHYWIWVEFNNLGTHWLTSIIPLDKIECIDAITRPIQ